MRITKWAHEHPVPKTPIVLWALYTLHILKVLI